MKRRLMGFKSQYLILLGIIFMVVMMFNIGNSSAANTHNLTDHHNGMIKKSSSNYFEPTNNRTKERFKSIDDAVNSENTIKGDTIIVGAGNYLENVNINKKVSLVSFTNANITAKNPDLPIFTIYKNGSGTVIKGFNFVSDDPLVSNAILLNSANGCTLSENNFIDIPGVSIKIQSSQNSRVSYNSFKEGMDGIDIANSKNITINGNSFIQLLEPIFISRSWYIQIYNNNLTNSRGSEYIVVDNCSNSSIDHNNLKATINNPTALNLIHTLNSENNVISYNYMKTLGTMSSLELQNSNSNHVVGNKITGPEISGCGIQLVESDNNLIKNNVVGTLFAGVRLISSLNNSVMNNNISKIGDNGISLLYCFGTKDLRNLLGYNNISSCINGIQLELSFHNSIFNNTISNSDQNNIYSLNSECNTFYQNNLLNAPTGILFKNSDDCTVVSNVITSNIPNSYGVLLENNNSATSNVVKTLSASKPIIVGSVPVTILPDIDVHFNRIICPVGIKNGNSMVTVNAGQNWWGSNHPTFTKLVSGKVKYPNWIYMTITTKTQRTIQGSKLTVKTSFNNLYDGKTWKSFNKKLGYIPNSTINFFVTNLGKFEGNYVKTESANGEIVAIYSATKLGKATLTSTTDNQTLKSTIIVEPVLKVLKLNTTPQITSQNYGQMKLYLNKAIKDYNSTWIELKQVSKPYKLISFKTSRDSNHIYIAPKTALKKGVTYKLIVHSNSIKDYTGNGLSTVYIKTFKL
ncbi:MAG: right-handed parallel beta-helix repeat-containing protein [Methanobacterium sp. ERen5]|nr:MAG: right-handed parallel beta-helix repeat-containing protein [Methanobacterium sp. ERen5]